MRTETALTTSDNPYSPFEEFDLWYAYDEQAGYHTPSYLARVSVSSDELSETDKELSINLAIDEIVKLDALGIYRKVTRVVDD